LFTLSLSLSLNLIESLIGGEQGLRNHIENNGTKGGEKEKV